MRTFVVWSQLLVVPVFMLLWVTLLVLAPVSEQLETPPKSMISLQFPWTVFFQEESMELTCKGFGSSYSPRITKWYLGEKKLRETKASTLKVQESGDYTCQAGDLPKSNTVHLDFSKASLILQGPLDVFEGDSVLLRCRARAETELNTLVFYKNNEALILPDNSSCLHLNDVNLEHNGDYYCAGYKEMCCEAYSNAIRIQVQALFPLPVLRTSSDKPTEGSPVTLTCETQLPPQRSDVQLQFRFFKGSRALGAGWSSSPELQIPAMWREDSGSYWCQAKTLISGVLKDSKTSYISVQRVVANIQISTVPALESVFEGQELKLICSVDRPLRPMTFSWYKKAKQKKETKIHLSSEAEFRISMVKDSDAGDYYCEVNNSGGSIKSEQITIKPRKAPVSRPVLTLSPAGGQVSEGTWVTFHCEVQRGSPPIRYQFFRKDALLQKIGDRPQEARSASISLTAERSGNYFCTADNGFRPQHSEAVRLSVITPVSRPVLTLSPAKGQVFEGTWVTLYCEVQRGSPPILYKFYHESFLLGSSSTPSRRGASYGLSLTAEHSGNFYCTADNSIFSPQRSKAVSLSVLVPVSRPILTHKSPRTQTVVGDVIELCCEAMRGSFPILYTFYHEDVTLGSLKASSRRRVSFRLSLTAEHSGNYFCEARNSEQTRRSDTMTLIVIIPVSRPVLTLRAPRAQAVLGDVVELHCEALTGSPPILYQFYHGDVTLGNISAPSGGGTSFNLSLTAEHSGNYFCEARNDVQTQRSDTMTLSVTIPVSRPVLTLRAPRAQTVVGDVVELHCEAMTGSPPILYQFYHGDVTLGSSTAPSGGGASFNLSLTAEHSGNYSCEADNGPETQHSEAVTLSVTVPVSHPVLTLRTPRTGALVGDEVELHCEALRGSPPILYWFYHEDVTLGNISAPSGGGASFNLSLTEEHSGNYSCEADNGLGAQRSEVVTLFITGLTENRSGPVATGVTGGLLSVVSLAAGALLFYWLSRKAGRQAASDPSRCSSDSNPQDPTYHNVPGWVGLQPVYMNVNSRGEDVVYSEVWGLQKKNKHSAACAHSLSMDEDSSVIYSKVKGTCTPALGSQQLASPAPHR